MTSLMTVVVNALARVREEEEGQGLVEYGLILSLIALVCIGALTGLGTAIAGLLGDIAGEL